MAVSVVAASCWYPDSVSAAGTIAVVRTARQILGPESLEQQ